MSNPEGYNPELPENINARNEAHDINKMVDDDLLTRQEAGEFAYENEMEIPEEMLPKLSAPPKVTERMRQHIITKFSPESFEPENIAGTVVHGTYIHAARPIWLGENNVRTDNGGKDPDHIYASFDSSTPGIFEIVGDATRLDSRGFLIGGYNESGKYVRSPGWNSFPIYLVLERSKEKTYLDQVNDYSLSGGNDDYMPEEEGGTPPEPYKEINAVILSADERNLINSDDNKPKKYLVAGRDEKLFMTLNQEANYIAHCMVKGIDKSKIVPIYDWDGNLLWPTEDDVIREENDEVQISNDK